jgi:hypothetical protein
MVTLTQSIINSWNFLLKFVSFVKIIDCVMDLVRFQLGYSFVEMGKLVRLIDFYCFLKIFDCVLMITHILIH